MILIEGISKVYDSKALIVSLFIYQKMRLFPLGHGRIVPVYIPVYIHVYDEFFWLTNIK